jgi:hypothetical protein
MDAQKIQVPNMSFLKNKQTFRFVSNKFPSTSSDGVVVVKLHCLYWTRVMLNHLTAVGTLNRI